jgi:peptidyl-tRNA hydrolase, PTH1 family
LRWIIGLGNPGSKYAMNRHNVGFMAVDRFASEHGIAVTQNKFKALYGEGVVNGVKVALLKPMTYMNLSGESLRAFLDYTKSAIEDGVVVYDDLDTPFGQMRLRYQGSSGGHNGIKSIAAHTGTQTFNRIRIGVSRPQPGYDIADYVLSDFSKAEQRGELEAVLERTVSALTDSLGLDFEKVMAKYNG